MLFHEKIIRKTSKDVLQFSSYRVVADFTVFSKETDDRNALNKIKFGLTISCDILEF